MTTIQHKPILNSAEHSSMPGIILLMTSIFTFSLHHVIIKTLSSNYALLQLSLIRTIFSTPIVLSMLVFDSGFSALRTKTVGLQILRGSAMF